MAEQENNDAPKSELSVDNEFDPSSQRMYDFLRRNVIGQEGVLKDVVKRMSHDLAGINDPRLPAAVFVFAGPTGSGKTLLAQALAQYRIPRSTLYKDPLTAIQGGLLLEKAELSTLIGISQGHVGFDEQKIRLAQRSIDEPHLLALFESKMTKKGLAQLLKSPDRFKKRVDAFYEEIKEDAKFRSVILFDEVDKATDRLWNILLHICDDGRLTLMDGQLTNFSRSIIVLTTNFGGKETQGMMRRGRGGVGFALDTAATQKDFSARLRKETIRILERHLPPEMVGRLLENIFVFRVPSIDDARRALPLEFAKIQELMVLRNPRDPITLQLTNGFREKYPLVGFNPVYGLRSLARSLDRHVGDRLAWHLLRGDFKPGNHVLVDFVDGQVVMSVKQVKKSSAKSASVEKTTDPT